MSWTEDIQKAIQFIETNIYEDISVDDVADHVHLSPFYFQKGFTILCGFSPAEYIRNRRLSLAARDLTSGECKVIDVAMKYFYDSPDSFTKAFTRFHGITPISAKTQKAELRHFLPLHFQISMTGGFEMDCKIVKKAPFTIIGFSKTIDYDKGYIECPKFWDEHYRLGRGQVICGMYAVCDDNSTEPGKFKYIIGDDYVPSRNYPDECETFVIPEKTWAVFKCIGAMPTALQSVNTKIFKEWLPDNPDYVIDGGYNIEYYTDATKYEKGTQDENYVSEIWVPVRAK